MKCSEPPKLDTRLRGYEDYGTLVEQAGEGHPYVVRRPDIGEGEPIVRGTRIPVRNIVERVQLGQSVDEILAAFPHLNTAQVYDALSYYHGHQVEMDRLIEESQPEQVIAAQGLRVENVGDGVAVIHDDAGRWQE